MPLCCAVIVFLKSMISAHSMQHACLGTCLASHMLIKLGYAADYLVAGDAAVALPNRANSHLFYDISSQEIQSLTCRVTLKPVNRM